MGAFRDSFDIFNFEISVLAGCCDFLVFSFVSFFFVLSWGVCEFLCTRCSYSFLCIVYITVLASCS